MGTGNGVASSYGVGASSTGAAQTSAVGSLCTGITAQPPTPTAMGFGDYLEIANLQPTIGTAGSVVAGTRICGVFFNAIADAIEQATACSFATPFKVGVHF